MMLRTDGWANPGSGIVVPQFLGAALQHVSRSLLVWWGKVVRTHHPASPIPPRTYTWYIAGTANQRMAATEALTSTDLHGALPLVAQGKVRDIYALPDEESLLFVATDRISAYDVVMKNVCVTSFPGRGLGVWMVGGLTVVTGQGIKDKGKLLTALSEFWFEFLKGKCPNHLLSTRELPEAVAPYRDQLEGRSMVVKKHKIFPVEAIVRGYITGSAWAEYKKKGTVHGIKVPEGMQESQKFETPLFTPSTKAEQGEHGGFLFPRGGGGLWGIEADDLGQMKIFTPTRS
jgi:phosphoribosylaminoimidazole-succinocarboxamide synthase